MAKASSSEEAHCNRCGTSTNHVIEHSYKRSWEEVFDEDDAYRYSIDGWDRWEMLRCLGCDDVHLRKSSYFSEDSGPRGEPVVRHTFYPARLPRRKPAWQQQMFPFNLDLRHQLNLLDEVYDALAKGSCRLAAMGIRSLVEQVMIDQVEDQGTFKKNIQAFFDAGFVAPRQQKDFEDVLIEAGHAAMHRGFDPAPSTIETLLDIVEPLIDEIYFKPHRTKEAGKSIPAKRK